MACPANHPKLNKTVRVAVTGAAGNIGYALLFRLASGAVFGPNTPVQLQLLERDNEQSKAALQGVCMELFDCAFPLLTKVVTTSDPRVAFDGANAAFLIGSMPRGAGMDRSDLLLANGPIFQEQGRALDEAADRNVKVLVVGNPCNTNAYIAYHHAPNLDPKCFSAMMRLDANRAVAQLAEKTQKPVCSIQGVRVWGNHSNSMYPDITAATIAGTAATELVDEAWYNDYFLPTVATRGGAIIKARGKSSAASAASAGSAAASAVSPSAAAVSSCSKSCRRGMVAGAVQTSVKNQSNFPFSTTTRVLSSSAVTCSSDTSPVSRTAS